MRLRNVAIGALGALVMVAAAPAAMAKDSAPRPTLEWIGFHPVAGGGSELFFVLSHAVAPREVAAGDRVYLVFDGVVPGKSNHLRALDTRFFESTVSWVKAKKIGKKGCKACLGKKAPGSPSMTGAGIIVTIAFRKNAQATYQLTQEDTMFDPSSPNGPREGVQESGKPAAEPRQRRMVRLVFPPPGPDVPVGGETGPGAVGGGATNGRPRLEEPKPGKIVIPPAPKTP